jgi:RNA recognition motif-containing protein
MSIQNIITQIATLQAEITGIKRAFDETPDSLNEFPCFVNFPSSGDIERIPGQRKTKHIIKMQLRVIRADLPSAENKVRPFLDSVLDKFDANITLNGAVSRSAIIHYDYGSLPWGGREYLGISFDIEVWETETLTFQA